VVTVAVPSVNAPGGTPGWTYVTWVGVAAVMTAPLSGVSCDRPEVAITMSTVNGWGAPNTRVTTPLAAALADAEVALSVVLSRNTPSPA
jgi:hypothetical protein